MPGQNAVGDISCFGYVAAAVNRVMSSIGTGYDFCFSVDFVCFTVCSEKENP